MPASFSQIIEVWRRLKPGQRVVVIGAALATIAFAAVLIVYGSRPEYGVLFSDLKPADAQTIVEKLKAENIPHQLSGGGTTVSVPFERIAELRLEMAASGALSGGHVGFDIFDKNSFGATDFAQQVNYQRALEGELARTLEGMSEVQTARVHITRPRESLFADKAERAKASVVLGVRQGRELSRERTESVVSLIASAVEGLDPSEVSVMDTQGRLLSAPARAGGDDSSTFNSHLEARRKLETETAARIISLLEPVTGAGHVRADVAANLDFSKVEQTEEKYDPQSAVIRSQQTLQEARNTTAAAPVGGVTGARANDPTTQTPPAPVPTPPAAGDQRAATTTNYEIDKTVRHTVGGGGGRVTRLSVSVAVDYKMVNGTATVRPPEELQKIQELVAAAVGIDPTRGDQIVVQAIPFNQPTAEVSTPTWVERYRDLIRMGIKYGMLALAALVLVIFVVRPARRALRAAATAATPPPHLLAAGQNRTGAAGELTDGDAARREALETGQLDGDQTAKNLLAPRTVAELEAEMKAELDREMATSATPQVKRANVIKKQLVERSSSEPEMIAMTLRSWLQDAK